MNPFPKKLDSIKIAPRDTFNHSFAGYTVSMRSNDLHVDTFSPRTTVLKKVPWVRGLVCLAVAAFVPLAVGFPQSQVGNGLPYPPASPGMLPMNRMANPTADANRLMEDSMKRQNNSKQFEQLNVQRQKEMTSETAALLELAHELKIETDKAAPDTLPIDIRKAELIEKLAHNIQHKMRASASD